MLDKMARSGLTGAVAMPTALAVHCQAMIPTGWDLLPLEHWWSTRAQAKIREALRLGMLAEGARRGGKNYQMKVRAKRRLLPAGQMLGWRALAALADPLPLIRGIERALPAPRQDFPAGCTHLLLPTLIHEDEAQAGLVKAARRAGAPVWAIPASWDTLMTKGRFLDQPDRIAVWGQASAHHAVCDHAFPPAGVTITGPPHFYPYQAGYQTPKFVVGSSRYVLFAGTTVNYAPDEVAIVAGLARALADGPDTRDVRIVYRPHPRALTADIAPLAAAAGVVMDPRWRGNWSLSPADIPYIKMLAQGALCTVSAFSTVALESAFCSTPSVLIGFGSSAHGAGKALDHANYEHMAEIAGKPGIRVESTMAGLLERIRAIASGRWPSPDERRALRHWALQIAAVDLDPRDAILAWLQQA